MTLEDLTCYRCGAPLDRHPFTVVETIVTVDLDGNGKRAESLVGFIA